MLSGPLFSFFFFPSFLSSFFSSFVPLRVFARASPSLLFPLRFLCPASHFCESPSCSSLPLLILFFLCPASRLCESPSSSSLPPPIPLSRFASLRESFFLFSFPSDSLVPLHVFARELLPLLFPLRFLGPASRLCERHFLFSPDVRLAMIRPRDVALPGWITDDAPDRRQTG